MEGFLICGWDLILHGRRWLYEPNIGVSKPCGAVPIGGITDFVPGVLEL